MTSEPQDPHGRRPGFAEVLDAGTTVTLVDAARLLIDIGFDRESVHMMINEFLHAASREAGVQLDRRSLDGADVAEIARRHEWVDRYRGETLAQARHRATHHAEGWARRAEGIDRAAEPGYAARAERAAQLWAGRARVPEPFTAEDPLDRARTAVTGLEAFDADVRHANATANTEEDAMGWEQ